MQKALSKMGPRPTFPSNQPRSISPNFSKCWKKLEEIDRCRQALYAHDLSSLTRSCESVQGALLTALLFLQKSRAMEEYRYLEASLAKMGGISDILTEETEEK